LRNPFGSKVLIAGVAGVVLGSVTEMLINHLAGATVVTDGVMWGAVLAILIVSLPNFARMGALVTKGDKLAVNFVVGIGMFVLISVVVVAIFFGLFWFIGRFIS